MASFLERTGRRQPRSVIQIDSFDPETRSALSNVLTTLESVLNEQSRRPPYTNEFWSHVGYLLWQQHYKQPVHGQNAPDSDAWKWAHNDVLGGEWEAAVDLIDFLGSFTPPNGLSPEVFVGLRVVFNSVFEKYLVALRFIDGMLMPVADAEEAQAIADASESAESLPGVRRALRSAALLLSDRENPQYAKSVAESIGAVEATIRYITDAKDLSSGLKKLESKGIKIHKALMAGWTSIYGYASDESGIRHHSASDVEIDQDLALYFLVSCSAFVSYLLKQL